MALTLAAVLIGCAPAWKRPPANESYTFGKSATARGYSLFMASELEMKKGNLDRAAVLMQQAIQADPKSPYLQFQLAVLYLLQRDQTKALQVIEGIIETHPSYVDALMMLGRISQGQGRMQTAKKAYHRVLSVDPAQKDVYALLGKIYLDEGKLDQALHVYQQLVKQFPDSYLGHFFIGKIFAEKGKLDAAEMEFKETLALAPDLEEPYYELLELYKRQGKQDKTLGIYKAILERNPGDLEALMGLGLYYHHHGAVHKADVIFQELGRRSQQNRIVAAQLASSYLDREAYADAMVILKGMLKAAPRNSDLNYLMGVAEDASGNKKAAILYLKKVAVDSDFYHNAVLHIAFLYQDAHQISKAIGFLEKAVAKIPPTADLYLYLGSFYEENGQLKKAEAAFLKGLKIDPGNVKIHFRLGVDYDKQGDRQASIRQMKRVIQLDPSHTSALNYLGYTYAEMGVELDQAEKMVLRALKNEPNDGYITDSLGWIYFKKGQLKQAITTMKKAVSLLPDDPTILEHMGDVYLKAAEPNKALEFYRRSLKNQDKDNTRKRGAAKAVEDKIRSLTDRKK